MATSAWSMYRGYPALPTLRPGAEHVIAVSDPSLNLVHVTDTLLRSLREHMLDEAEPLAGLLRKCLLLGAETGSEALRYWARKELNGYDSGDDVPEYRLLTGVPISMDSMSGNTWATGQIMDRLQLPPEAQKYVTETIPMRQPIEELEKLAGQENLSFKTSALAYAQTLWNEQLGPFQQVMGLKYVMSGSAMSGILGQIRTQLVDVVADLTADTPLSDLPKKDQVDAAVSHRIGNVYNTTIQEANGPVAIGSKAKASTEGLNVDDALRLLQHVRTAADEAEETDRAELLEAVEELRAAVEQERPDTGDVVKKVRKLRAIANKIGVASISAATGGAAQALTELAVSGAFG